MNFYIQLLEQEPKNLIPDVYAEFQISSLCLGIFKPKQNYESEFAVNTKSSLSFCLEVDNLESAIAHL